MLNRYIPVRTGEVSADAADYLKEVTEQMVKVNYSPAEQKLADFYIRAQLKRDSEDDYIREEEREKAEAEKINTAKKLLSKGL